MGDSVHPLGWIGVGSSFVLSGLFYRLYQEKKKELEKMKEVPLFKPDQHLVRVLNESPLKRLQYVAVEGLVQADGEPLASRFVPRCFGVVQRITVEERWKCWNATTRSWSSRTTNRTESSNAVPFSLVGPGAFVADVSVKVLTPLEAAGCYLERVHLKSRHAHEGLVSAALHGIAGERPEATAESEELLRVGSTLTGFGEVVLEGGGAMRLQAPRDGRRYVLVPGDHGSFLDRHQRSASMWKMLTAAAGVTGSSILAGIVYGVVAKRDGKSKSA
ncbi:mitochondrial ubiquitin ligase activator of nfkb 1-A [Brachionichthys hirsutus]|uniref:mitochondrial ubiquitin ligase activator of nfkb 1-A n=1 Tax=Brachionichthys hirsutus TaxID=412623 RepID=UPI003604467B